MLGVHMSNEFQVTEQISYLQNIKKAIGAVFLGAILFILSFCLLWWNEGNYVSLLRQEDFIKKNAIAVNPDVPEKSNNSKLIATYGRVYTTENLSDSLISVNKALRLERKVEMYQWIEHKKVKKTPNKGGSTTKTTTYSYTKDWDKIEHNSENFKKTEYKNPKFTIKTKSITANSATLGAFKLRQEQISLMKNFKGIEKLVPVNGYKIVDNYYYKGKNFSEPQVGDIRISYRFIPSGSYLSIIGQQNNNTIVPMYTSKDGIYLQSDGMHSLEGMLHSFKQRNKLLTFGFRLMGFIIMFGGLFLMLNPIIAIANYFPLLGTILEFTTIFTMAIISLCLSLITIAIAWFVYRPVLSVFLIILAAAGIYYIKKHIQKKKSEKPIQQ